MPPMRHSVARHDAEVMSEDDALGTTSEDQVPLDSRYSPTLVGGRFEPVVPSAIHEPDNVQALVCSGTEIPSEGSPVTCGDGCWAQLASARALTMSKTQSRQARGTFNCSRLIVMCVLSCESSRRC